VIARTAIGPRPAITFLINHAHERYAGRLDDAAIVRSIATACGPLGACAEYLFNTTAHLDELGIVDRSLRRLCGLVRDAQRTAG
jgi:glutathione-specific gamma-glutamylcyclotransferase